MPQMRLGLCAALACAVLAAEPEVQIETVFKPDKCDELPKAQKGMAAALILTGYIHELNSKFTEYNEGQKMETVIGSDKNLVGLHQGVEGMCVGEKRKLIVPPELGHGDAHWKADFSTIPPGSTLRFEVELSAVGKGVWHEDGKPVNIFEKMDANTDGKLSEEEFNGWFKAYGQGPPPDLFKKEDKDNDGFVSLEEFTGPKGQQQEL